MDNLFIKLKKSLKNRFIIVLSIGLVLLIAGIVLSIIFKDYMFVIYAMALASLFPVTIFMLYRKKFKELKIKCIEETFKSVSDDEFKIDYAKNQTIHDFEVLGADRFGVIYNISATIYGMINENKVTAYGVRFKDTKGKHILGRLIKIEFKELNKTLKDIHVSYFRDAKFFNNVKIVDNTLYLIGLEYQKNKGFERFSYEPFDFKTLDDYKKNILNELNLIKKLLK